VQVDGESGKLRIGRRQTGCGQASALKSVKPICTKTRRVSTQDKTKRMQWLTSGIRKSMSNANTSEIGTPLPKNRSQDARPGTKTSLPAGKSQGSRAAAKRTARNPGRKQRCHTAGATAEQNASRASPGSSARGTHARAEESGRRVMEAESVIFLPSPV
jgi:hypothetical protein